MLLLGIALGIFFFNYFYANCIDLGKILQKNEPILTLEDEIFNDCGQVYPWKKLRLPSDIRPNHYKLKIHPNLETLKLTGTVEIELEVLNATNRVVLHAYDMNLTSFTFRFGAQLVPVRHVS